MSKTLAQKLKNCRLDLEDHTDAEVEEIIIGWAKSPNCYPVECDLCGKMVQAWLKKNHNFHNHY